MNLTDFSGKVVVITGGGGGIGRAAALLFARNCARIVVVDVDAELGRATAAEVEARGGQAIFVGADVSSSADVEAYVRASLDEFGQIDVFLNNAAWEGATAPISEYPEETFDKVIGINLKGVFLGLKHVLPVMMAQKGGVIVNTSSLAGHIGTPGLVAYTAAKHAVLGMTKTAALEGGAYGIRVNAVCPGAVDTRMLRNLAGATGVEKADENMRRFAEGAANCRLGSPEDIANVMLFLSSELATHMSGQSLRVDGGRIMF